MATHDKLIKAKHNGEYTQVVALALHSPERNQFLIFRRNRHQSGAGKWEFPGGKVEAGESLIQALTREIQEELDLNLVAEKLIYIGDNKHSYSSKKINISLYRYSLDQPVFKLIDHDESAWINQSNCSQYDISDADLPFLSQIFKV